MLKPPNKADLKGADMWSDIIDLLSDMNQLDIFYLITFLGGLGILVVLAPTKPP